MAAMQEQRDLANEIGAAISDPMNAGIDMDEVSLNDFIHSSTRPPDQYTLSF